MTVDTIIKIDNDRLAEEGAWVEFKISPRTVMIGECFSRDLEGLLIVIDPNTDLATFVRDDEVEKITYGIFS